MKRIAGWLGIALAVLLLIVLGLSFLIDANAFRPKLESNLATVLGRAVKLGELKLTVLSGGVSASDLSIQDDPAFSMSPFLRAKQLSVAVELDSLIFSRKLNVTGLTIDQPEIVLLESAPGVWNFSSLGTKAGAASPTQTPAPASSGKGALDLSVKLVKITNGRLTLSRTNSTHKPIVLEQVNIELQDVSSTSAFPFSLTTKVAGGGTVKLNGKAGPLDQTDAARTPVSASLSVTDLDLALSRLNDWAPTLAGIVSFSGTGNSDGKSVRVDGKLKADKLKLARNATPARRTVEFDFGVQHDVKNRSGVLNRGDIHIGGARASLTGSYAERGDSMLLKMSLSGSNMPVPELAELLPALGIVLPSGSSLRGGVAKAKLSMDGMAERLVTTGSAALNNTKLTGFDMGKKMSTIEKLAGIKSGPDTDIQNLSMNVRYAPEGANLQDIKLVVAGIGEMSGNGTVSPSDALDFKMSAMVQTSGLAAVISHTPIPFHIRGTAADPVFQPDIKGLAAGELKSIDPGKAASGILKGIFGGKKKN